MKSLLIALIVSMLMSVTAYAGVPEAEQAFLAKDYPLCITLSDAVLADSKALDTSKVNALRFKGISLYNQKKYDEARVVYQKLLADFPKFKAHGAVAQYYIGHCYIGQRDYVKANIAYLKVLTDYSEYTLSVAVALDRIKFTSMTDEEVLTILKRIRRANMIPVKDLKSKVESVKKAADEKFALLEVVGNQIANIEGVSK